MRNLRFQTKLEHLSESLSQLGLSLWESIYTAATICLVEVLWNTC